jgi:hypothetical protein
MQGHEAPCMSLQQGASCSLLQGARLERERGKKKKKREEKKKKMNLSHIEYEQIFFHPYFYKKAT